MARLHRHALMTMIAYAFLQHRRLAATAPKKKNQRTPASAKSGVKRGPIRPASRELTTFVLVRWRSAYVPPGKAESTRALPSRIRCGLHHQRKRSQELSGINCVAATIHLTGREPATLDCFVDRRFGHTCGPCCAAWCVHSATSALR